MEGGGERESSWRWKKGVRISLLDSTTGSLVITDKLNHQDYVWMTGYTGMIEFWNDGYIGMMGYIRMSGYRDMIECMDD